MAEMVKEQKQEDAWLRVEAESLRAEYVRGMEFIFRQQIAPSEPLYRAYFNATWKTVIARGFRRAIYTYFDLVRGIANAAFGASRLQFGRRFSGS